MKSKSFRSEIKGIGNVGTMRADMLSTIECQIHDNRVVIVSGDGEIEISHDAAVAQALFVLENLKPKSSK